MREPILRVQSGLTGRDLTLLGWLADHGVLTTDQIAAALFPSVNVAQRRLRALMGWEVIDRFRPQRADGGSYPYHWLLSQLGTDTIAMQRGEPLPRRDQARARRWQLTSRANLPHLLGVNGFFTALAAHARTHPHAALERWWSAARCQQLGAFATPADAGRVDATVLAYKPRVRPDGHGIFTEHHRTVSFFLEYDTGTEPLPVLIAKLDGYHEFARRTGHVYPVLFWLHSSLREQHLHQRLTDAGIRYPVATATRDPTSGKDPVEAVWWLHGHLSTPLRLTELPATPAASGAAA